jgi:hypothetical protein
MTSMPVDDILRTTWQWGQCTHFNGEAISTTLGVYGAVSGQDKTIRPDVSQLGVTCGCSQLMLFDASTLPTCLAFPIRTALP